ncbi:unnamed protein product [Diatraea saccharalis]|uniref:Uncharacterized protein n=1 Tax=Diatraea saccharalis TaxID=40085 RepID=A0A9P0C7X4_9NEOP|nr:unnamed protein product [Diatraea saccharalis]
MNQLVFVVCCLAMFLLYSNGRKYDVDEECKKIYGENLGNVLKRFRRTPDYMKILNIKRQEILENFQDITTQVLIYETNQMKQKIYKMYNLSAPIGRSFSPETGHFGDHHLRSFSRYRHKNQHKREGEDEETTPSVDGNDNNEKLDAEEHNSEDKINPIELLEDVVSEKILSVAETNKFRDIGFETAGKVLHGLIKSYDGDNLQKSTRFPVEGKYTEKYSTITEHVHEVSSTAQAETTQGDGVNAVEGDETFFYRHKAYKKPKKVK